MKLLNLDCNNCGAGMEVRVRRGKREEVACDFCGSTALVEETPRTRPLEGVGELSGARAELARLDAAWRRQRRSFEGTDKNGNTVLPSQDQVVGAFIGAVLAVFMGIMIASRSGESFMSVPLFIGSAFMVAVGFATRRKLERFQHARARYKRRRREILSDGGALKAAERPKLDPGLRHRRWLRRRKRR